LSIPKWISVFDKDIDLDVTNMYIHKIEKEPTGDGSYWLNRFYFVLEFYSNSVVLPLKSVGQEFYYGENALHWIERELITLFKRYFSIGIGPMIPNPEMEDWEMQRWEYAYDEAKKDPRWDQELQDKYDKSFKTLDLEALAESFADDFNIDTSQNDNIRKEYEEQFEQLYGHDRPREQIIAKEYSSLVLDSDAFDLLTDRIVLRHRGQVLFTQTVRNMSSKVDLTSNDDLIIIYPLTTHTKSRLRKR